MKTLFTLALTAAATAALLSPAAAQIVPAQPLDSPSAPLSGPPLNQPPRQIPPESDTVSDPALVNAHNPAPEIGSDKREQACARNHAGYNAATRSYVDDQGRQHSCG